MIELTALTAAQPSDSAYHFGLNAPDGWLSRGDLLGFNSSLAISFTTFVNDATKQLVIVLKGENNKDSLKSDFSNSGYSEWESIKLYADVALPAIRLDPLLAGHDVVPDGRSLGGGVAQTFALKNMLSGYEQNSLPTTNATIATDLDGKTSTQIPDCSSRGYMFHEINKSSDPATLIYSIIEHQTYLDPSPTILENPYVTAEVVGVESAGSFGEALAAWSASKAHSISTTVTCPPRSGPPIM